jgi:hypothetical protein
MTRNEAMVVVLTQWMGEIDDYKRRENIKGMEKLIEHLLCEDKKEHLLREDERMKEYLLHEDKENKTFDDL